MGCTMDAKMGSKQQVACSRDMMGCLLHLCYLTPKPKRSEV